MRFKCSCCDEVIDGIPTYGWDRPLSYFDVAEDKRDDIFLTEDLCVIQDEIFLIKGCIEIPVMGHKDPFIWGVWVSLSEENFFEFQEILGKDERAHYGPYFGWLNAHIRMYPKTANLKTSVVIRNNKQRPLIRVEHNGHPLGCEQHEGISLDRVAEIYACFTHKKCPEIIETITW